MIQVQENGALLTFYLPFTFHLLSTFYLSSTFHLLSTFHLSSTSLLPDLRHIPFTLPQYKWRNAHTEKHILIQKSITSIYRKKQEEQDNIYTDSIRQKKYRNVKKVTYIQKYI